MNKTEINLEITTEGQVAQKIVSPTLNVDFNSGSVQIGGTLQVMLINEKLQNVNLPFDQFNIRIADLDTLQVSNASDEAQAAIAAKRQIFQTLFDTVKLATQTAAQAIYQLNNPAA